MERGKFIVLDGIDGSGKSTQTRLATKTLRETFQVETIATSEPTWRTSEIREKLSGNFDAREDREWFAQKFIEDRILHCVKDIGPALESGTYVVCDRYKYSTIAYQHTRGMEIEDLVSRHVRPEILIPDLTLLITLPAREGFTRRNSSGKTDAFDKDYGLQKSVLEVYQRMPEIFPGENIQFVSGVPEREVVAQEIKKYLDKLFG